jgi:threonine dehydratase
VLLKAELFQRTGSFKTRGVLAKLATLTAEQRECGVIAASSGNHAQALAFCARDMKIDCTVVMWAGASPQKIEAARAYGARVDLEADDAPAALLRAAELALASDLTLIPAYDDPVVIAGQGTLGLELMEAVPEADVIVVPVSGGGLLAGVATAVKATSPKTRIVGVEPARSPSLKLALAAGKPVPVPQLSIADGLGAPAIGELCLTIAQALIDDVVEVEDEQIIEAMGWLYQTAKLACEPAGAAATAALLAGRVRCSPGQTVIAIVSGGNIDPETAAQLLRRAEAG